MWKIRNETRLSTTSYLLGIFASLFALGLVIELLRRRQLRERHAIWWLIAGFFALLIAVFPQVLELSADLLGIEVPTNLVFFVSILILFLVALQHSSELTTLETKTRKLAEEIALISDKISSNKTKNDH